MRRGSGTACRGEEEEEASDLETVTGPVSQCDKDGFSQAEERGGGREGDAKDGHVTCRMYFCPTFDSNQFAANYPNVPNFVSHYTRERREERREESDGAAEYFSERAGAGGRGGPYTLQVGSGSSQDSKLRSGGAPTNRAPERDIGSDSRRFRRGRST